MAEKKRITLTIDWGKRQLSISRANQMGISDCEELRKNNPRFEIRYGGGDRGRQLEGATDRWVYL